MNRQEFEHIERQAKCLVPRARAGDDEALEALWFETRVPLFGLFALVSPKRRPPIAEDKLFEVLHLALLEAVVLWQQERGEDFCDAVNWRLRRRLGDYFLRQRSLVKAIEEVGGDAVESAG